VSSWSWFHECPRFVRQPTSLRSEFRLGHVPTRPANVHAPQTSATSTTFPHQNRLHVQRTDHRVSLPHRIRSSHVFFARSSPRTDQEQLEEVIAGCGDRRRRRGDGGFFFSRVSCVASSVARVGFVPRQHAIDRFHVLRFRPRASPRDGFQPSPGPPKTRPNRRRRTFSSQLRLPLPRCVLFHRFARERRRRTRTIQDSWRRLARDDAHDRDHTPTLRHES